MSGREAADRREGAYAAARIAELQLDPVRGDFGAAHLREIHRRITQDLPELRPGEYRPDAPGHVKYRVLENGQGDHVVHYAPRPEIDQRLDPFLKSFGGPAGFRGLNDGAFAEKMAALYQGADYLHPFTEMNSRALRSYTAQLALEAGRVLDWGTTHADGAARNRLYIARDVAVTQQAFPGLDHARAMKTNNLAEYEAYLFVIDRHRGADSLKTIIAESTRVLRVEPAQVRSADPYIDASTGVKRNKLGITDATALAKAEANFALLRMEQLHQQPIQGSFDLVHYRAIHKHILGDLYDWAGTPRTVDMQRNGQMLTRPPDIQPVAERMFKEIELERDFRGMPAERFIERSAQVLKDLSDIHIFRSGNQRTAQVFLEQLADNAGYQMDLSRVPLQQLQERLLLAQQGQSADALQPVIRQSLQIQKQAQLEL